MILQCGRHALDLSRPKIMGIINVTPDSFFDGGQFFSASPGKLNIDSVLAAAENMIAAGADILDVGGESTRPGARVVSVAEECDRVLPVVEVLENQFDVPISVDTSTPEVITACAELGAGLINDVRALERPGAIEAFLATGLPVCLMHMRGSPKTMQHNPHYRDVVSEVSTYLQSRVDVLRGASGDACPQILLDPGFGFGKSDDHNLALMKEIHVLCDLGLPVLVGVSRKSMIGRLLEREPHERLAGSLAFAMVALYNGASILRVHDVAETNDIVKVFNLTRFGQKE
ncbi:dihydropteroate synthase [Alteromonadaceae bacterium 2753L.S.0a.02]|nr:dihydropteroate synthase [Alteromonadaceae bacterium 2753L.S.0a.02]